MDARRFDELAKTLVSRLASRRQLAGGLLGGSLVTLVAAGERVDAARRCRKGNFCRSDGVRICDPENDCVCYRRIGGGNVCAAPGGECVTCSKDRDCRRAGLAGYHCVVNGRHCCGGRREGVCAAPCGTPPPCDGIVCNEVCCALDEACVGDPGACASCPVGGNVCDGNALSCDPFGQCSCVTSIEGVAVCSSMFGFCADCESDDQCSFSLGEQAVCIPAPDCCAEFSATRACVPATCAFFDPLAAAASADRRVLRPSGGDGPTTSRRSYWRQG